MSSINMEYKDTSCKFAFIVEKLLALTNKKISDKKLINACLQELNELNYRSITVVNKDALLLLINQLCVLVSPMDTSLVQNTCKVLANLIQNNIRLHGKTFSTCKKWVLEVLEYSQSQSHGDSLLVLKSFLVLEEFEDINHYLQFLLGNKGLLIRHLNPLQMEWNEINHHAVGCLEGILIQKYNGAHVSQEFINIIKDTVLNIVSSTTFSIEDRIYYSKILSSCLHVLHIIVMNKLVPISTDLMGEILGVVQAYLFHGIKDYPSVKPQVLRPAAMNLPERAHTVPKCKNLKNHKAKMKKQPMRKKDNEIKNNIVPECKGIGIYSSDSDTSDTETNNSVYVDSKVRLESVHLLQALIENSQSRDMFGYWPQIVATGSRNNAHVLTRCVLKEPVSKVKQNVLSTLTELLIGAKSFLMHAEDVQHMSFITFFGTVSLMIKELHFTLSSVLKGERNVAVLTHGLKCAAALIQGTPYARLKSGLITQLMRSCNHYVFHKDPTVRVAALSIFEALASSEPVTPEIFAILAKQSAVNVETDKMHISVSSISDIGTDEEEEVDIEDLNSESLSALNNERISEETNVSWLVQVCLENISNKTLSTPVRLQSLKLIGRMAFNTRSLIFSRLELVTNGLAGVIQDIEAQVILHTCRALEIIAGCLTNTDTNDSDASTFWSLVFDPITSLVQHPQTILREAACDCLGSIGSTTFGQLSRQKAVLLITVLFGSVRDEESAVRAAGLRALGMLVTLPPIEEETGFLMDLADMVCESSGDKNLGVRVKAAWALANLCDCISRKKNNEESEPLPLELLLPKLYQVSVKGSKDSDKVKCNAVRALGTILYLCSDMKVLNDTAAGLDALIACAILGNDMKVRWNACRALGLVVNHEPDNILPSSWRDQVFPALCSLICDSPNFKVRTNAAWALYSCNSYGKYTIALWKSIVLAFENSQHVPSFVEYPHRDALVQQLCLTLSHVAACTKVSELQYLWGEIGDHTEDISNYMKQFQETIVPEKMNDIIQAKLQLENYAKAATSKEEQRIAESLAHIFERTKLYDHLDITCAM